MDILIAVIIVTAVGAVAGIGLSVASILMAVPKNEKAEEINAILPGANCGACGFSGCSAYAEAIANGKPAPISLKAGLAMTIPGIYAEESSKRGGEVMRMKYPIQKA